MNGNEFLDKMELIDPAYVEAAAAVSKKRTHTWAKRGVAAACVALVLFAGTRLFSKDEPGSNSDLPMLSISESTSAGMGYEGYMAYDVSELINANPWNENSEISTLPVYRNSLTYDVNHAASGAVFDQMLHIMCHTVAGETVAVVPNRCVAELIPCKQNLGFGLAVIAETAMMPASDCKGGFFPVVGLRYGYSGLFIVDKPDLFVCANPEDIHVFFNEVIDAVQRPLCVRSEDVNLSFMGTNSKAVVSPDFV